MQTAGYSLLAIFFGAILLVAVAAPPRGLVGRLARLGVLRFFGKYSYGLYVYHGILSQHMLRLNTEDRLGALLGSHSRGIAAQAVLGVGISLLVAVLSYELFEKRFLSLKRLFEAQKSASPAPSSEPAPRPTERAA